MDDVLEGARWSGSASNRQPWELVVIWDRASSESWHESRATPGTWGRPLGIVFVMTGERPTQEAYDEGRLAERVMLVAWAHAVGSSVGWFAGEGRAAAKGPSKSPKNAPCAP